MNTNDVFKILDQHGEIKTAKLRAIVTNNMKRTEIDCSLLLDYTTKNGKKSMAFISKSIVENYSHSIYDNIIDQSKFKNSDSSSASFFALASIHRQMKPIKLLGFSGDDFSELSGNVKTILGEDNLKFIENTLNDTQKIFQPDTPEDTIRILDKVIEYGKKSGYNSDNCIYERTLAELSSDELFVKVQVNTRNTLFSGYLSADNKVRNDIADAALFTVDDIGDTSEHGHEYTNIRNLERMEEADLKKKLALQFKYAIDPDKAIGFFKELGVSPLYTNDCTFVFSDDGLKDLNSEDAILEVIDTKLEGQDLISACERFIDGKKYIDIGNGFIIEQTKSISNERFQEWEYNIASHYVTAIEYGDYSGLSDDDCRRLDAFMRDLPEGSKTWSYSEESNFTKDEVSGLMADCIESKLHIDKHSLEDKIKNKNKFKLQN
jgi:hypothetical protein